MLQAFGLMAPDHALLSHEPVLGDAWSDLYASCAVCIPQASDQANAYPSQSCDIRHNQGYGPSNGIMEIDERVFKLPSDARTRFRTLFATFPQLEADYYTTMTMAPTHIQSSAPSKPPNERETPKDRQQADKERDKKGRIPRWLLWTRGYAYD